MSGKANESHPKPFDTGADSAGHEADAERTVQRGAHDSSCAAAVFADSVFSEEAGHGGLRDMGGVPSDKRSDVAGGFWLSGDERASKHVAQYYARKDFRALGEALISTGLLLYAAIACAAASVLWAGARFLVGALFRGSPIPTPELTTLWWFLILLVFANILTLLFSSIAFGLQRMDLSSAMSTLNLVLSAGLSVTFLHQGLGLRGILYGYGAAAWVTTIVYAIVVWRLLPEVRLKLTSCRWRVAREILSFSTKAYVTQIAVAIHNQIEKFYLARFVGVVPVGWYDVSSDLALKLRGVPASRPEGTDHAQAASELDARNDHGRMMSLYLRAHKYLAFLGIPIVVYAVLISRRFVELWVGPSLSVIAISFLRAPDREFPQPHDRPRFS